MIRFKTISSILCALQVVGYLSIDKALANEPSALLIDGNFEVKGALRLRPMSEEPFNCDYENLGAIYFDNNQHYTQFCDGSSWQDFEGIAGDQGLQGVQGIQGATGLNGLQGAQGDIGEQGLKGETGLQGLQGVPGLPGDTYWSDYDSVVSTKVSVGVKTPAPLALLHVEGNVIASEATQDNHLITKGYSDTKDASLKQSIASLVVEIHAARLSTDNLLVKFSEIP